jgi:hypothetical protein
MVRKASGSKRPATARKRSNRRIAGGAATASGMNFQATVTAIAGVHLLLGMPLRWLEGIADDVPIAVWAETSGPGDDIRLELKEREVVEIQAKKGLQKGKELWTSLLALATSIQNGEIQYGLLAVAPDSSRNICYSLSQDIVRLAESRDDGLSEIGNEWKAKLLASRLDTESVCKRLRVHVVHALSADSASIVESHTKLLALCESSGDVTVAWSHLYRDAHAIAARRGRWEASSLAHLLATNHVRMKASSAPGRLVTDLARFAYENNQSFAIFGVKAALSISEMWLPLKAVVINIARETASDVAGAMARYHDAANNGRSNNRDEKIIDAEWIGRFYRHVVIEAGPGMGKSTLLTKLAHHYSRDGYPVLKFRLAAVAARMAAGYSFWESSLHLGLDGSGISDQEAARSGFQDWVLLCDGLDECGTRQESVAEGIRQFTIGHPHARVIVTTRRIGYDTARLSDWRHYEILPPDTSTGPANLANLLRATMSALTGEALDRADTIAREQLEQCAAGDVVSRSPHLLGMAASLLARGGVLGASKAELYQNLFGIIDTAPNARAITVNSPSQPLLTRVLNTLGWQLIADPLATMAAVSRRCAERLRLDMSVPALKAQEIVVGALQHWQDIGLVEQVHYGPTVMLTFVHKTFAEFAASRFLCDVSEREERMDLLSSCLDNQDVWSEVLSFASHEIGDEILRELINRDERGDRSATMTALRLLAESPKSASEQSSIAVIRLAFKVIDTQQISAAYRMGLLLSGIASLFPDEIGALLDERKNSTQHWTRLVAWACAVRTGRYDLNAAYSALTELQSGTEAVSGSLLGHLILREDRGSKLIENMALAMTNRVAAEWPTEGIDEFIDFASGFGSVGFQMDLSKALGKLGLGSSFPRRGILRNALSDFDIRDYMEAHDAALRAIFNGLMAQVDSDDPKEQSGPLLQMSGFFDLIGFDESPASDVWAWTERYDPEVVREIFRGIVQISVLDERQLQIEATIALSRLNSRSGKEHAILSTGTVDVDVPKLNWSRVASLNLDRVKLEEGVLHDSEWLARSATNLLHSCEQISVAEATSLLGRAHGFGFATACYLTRTLGDAGTDLLLDRFNGPIVFGFEYLISNIEKAMAPWSERIARGVQNALLQNDVRSARQAADLLLKYVQQGDLVSKEILEAAYQFWKLNEKPYPKKSGVVPESPRKTLLTAMNHLGMLPNERAIELLNDDRSDVVELACDLIVKRAGIYPEMREMIVTAITTKQIGVKSISRLLGSDISLDERDISRVLTLLSDQEPTYRLAALSLLHSTHMPTDQRREVATRMIDDAHLEVSDTARVIVEKLSS